MEPLEIFDTTDIQLLKKVIVKVQQISQILYNIINPTAISGIHPNIRYSDTRDK